MNVKTLVELVLHAFHLGKRAGFVKHTQRPLFHFKVEVGPKQERTAMPLKIKITDEQQIRVTLKPVTPKGQPAKLDGQPAWTVIDGNAQVSVAEDGLSALIVSPDAPGVTNIQVAADADLGDGVDTIADTIEVTVVDPNASSLGLTPGTPETK